VSKNVPEDPLTVPKDALLADPLAAVLLADQPAVLPADQPVVLAADLAADPEESN